MNSLIFLWFISENALFSSAPAPVTFVPLSVLMSQTLPLIDINLPSACMKASVDSEFVDSTLREICEYTWMNGTPHKSVMRSYADTVMKSKDIFPHNTA